VKVNPQDGAAIAMVARMDALFLVDRHARQQQVNTRRPGWTRFIPSARSCERNCCPRARWVRRPTIP
jgi:hypothetical protein